MSTSIQSGEAVANLKLAEDENVPPAFHFTSPDLDPAITIKNRRLLYLKAHNPSYFELPTHSHDLPTLYGQLVARFFTGREQREAAAMPGRQKKFSELLARDLERGEDRLESLRRQTERLSTSDGDILESVRNGETATLKSSTNGLNALPEEVLDDLQTEENLSDEDLEEMTLDPDILLRSNAEGDFNSITDRQEAWEIWCEILTRRFLQGEDEDIDYDAIDQGRVGGTDEIEKELERDGWERWYDEEEPEVMGNDGSIGNSDTGIIDY